MNNILAISLSMRKVRATSGDFQKWLRRRWTNWISFYFLRLKMAISMICCECAHTALALSIVSSRENILFFTLPHIHYASVDMLGEVWWNDIVSQRRDEEKQAKLANLKVKNQPVLPTELLQKLCHREFWAAGLSGHHESDCRIQRKEAHRCERVNYSLSSRQLKQEKLRSSSKASGWCLSVAASPKRWRMRLVLCVQEQGDASSVLQTTTLFISENLEVTTQLFVQKKHSPSNNYHSIFICFVRSLLIRMRWTSSLTLTNSTPSIMAEYANTEKQNWRTEDSKCMHTYIEQICT